MDGFARSILYHAANSEHWDERKTNIISPRTRQDWAPTNPISRNSLQFEPNYRPSLTQQPLAAGSWFILPFNWTRTNANKQTWNVNTIDRPQKTKCETNWIHSTNGPQTMTQQPESGHPNCNVVVSVAISRYRFRFMLSAELWPLFSRNARQIHPSNGKILSLWLCLLRNEMDAQSWLLVAHDNNWNRPNNQTKQNELNRAKFYCTQTPAPIQIWIQLRPHHQPRTANHLLSYRPGYAAHEMDCNSNSDCNWNFHYKQTAGSQGKRWRFESG